jgi:hypothetical protein
VTSPFTRRPAMTAMGTNKLPGKPELSTHLSSQLPLVRNSEAVAGVGKVLLAYIHMACLP